MTPTAWVAYYLPQFADSDTISLLYQNSEGDTIQQYTNIGDDAELSPAMGANKHVWNLSYAEATKFDGMILWWGSLAGPKAKPGEYTVTLTVNSESQSQKFAVLLRPNSEGTMADVDAQFSFVKSVNEKIDEAHQAVKDIRSLRKQMKAYSSKVDSEVVTDYAEQVDSIMTKVEKELYQTKNKSRQDPLNFPIRLTNKLAHLNALTQMGTTDYPPTDAAIAVRDELVGLIDAELSQWKEVKSSMLPKLNQMIRDEAVYTLL